MRTLTNSLLGLLAIFFSHTAFACMPAKMTPQERFSRAESVFIAFVKDKVALAQETQSLSPSSAGYPYQITVSVEKVLKSNPSKNELTYQLNNCGAGKAERGEIVIVYVTDGHWYVMPYEEGIK
jgi:hypothetical protein